MKEVQRSLHLMSQVVTLHQTKKDRYMGLIHIDISCISLKTKKQCIRKININKDVKTYLEVSVNVPSCLQKASKTPVEVELLTATEQKRNIVEAD